MRRWLLAVTVAWGCGMAGAAAPLRAECALDEGHRLVGRNEYVRFQGSKRPMKARMDTGAGVSSVNAAILGIETVEGQEWVNFELLDKEGVVQRRKEPLVDWMRIKRKDKEGTFIRRPVVKLHVCVAGKRILARFNLAERGHMLYPVLIGRNVLRAGELVVDADELYRQDPDCRWKEISMP